MMDIGFIGLGAMGAAMAANLAKGGHSVSAWNRSGGTLDGVHMLATAGAAFNADVVFTMLSDDPAIRSVVLDGKLLETSRPGLIHVVSSTISVAFAEELRTIHQQAGVIYVSAPVFGRPDVAAAGKLNIMAAGPYDALERLKPLFDIIGHRVFAMGEDPKQANAAKIAGNMMIAMAIESMAEAVALTSAHGVAPEVFLNLMLQTLFASRAYENYGGKILKGDYEAGFRLALGLKDLRLATAAGEGLASPLPMLTAVREQMAAAFDAGMGERDWSAMAEYTLAHGKALDESL